MGREIRMVPPNWSHPRGGKGQLQPMFDHTFEDSAKVWKDGFAEWESGVRPSYCSAENRSLQYWEWAGEPPADRTYYRPWSDEEATWYQLWETVSEGTPLTPPFATKQELADHLAVNGDSWYNAPWGKEKAETFVFGDGWAPSLVVIDGVVLSGRFKYVAYTD